jgi:hypothetical protein
MLGGEQVSDASLRHARELLKPGGSKGLITVEKIKFGC